MEALPPVPAPSPSPTPARASRAVTVGSRQGLHARPAARVVEAAKKFSATVSLVHGDARANAKDLLDVLYLAAAPGTVLEVEAVGGDAPTAVTTLVALFAALAAEEGGGA